MSTVIAKNVQVGTSGTATDNFTIFQPATPDGTLRIGNGNTGITTSQVALTSAGNVGIGTSSPQAKLQIQSGTSPTQPTWAATDVVIAGNSAGNASYYQAFSDIAGGIVFSTPSLRAKSFLLWSEGSGNMSLQNGATGSIVFTNNGSERMRIDSSGNVGVGTSSPGYRLDVAAGDTTANFGYAARLRSNATAGAATLQFTNSAVSVENGYIRVTDAGLMSFTDRAQITAAGLFQFNSGYGSVATAYGCRAWVKFNSAGTVSGSGNVSSVSKTGTGTYTVNFSSAMPDGNYAVAGASQNQYFLSSDISSYATGSCGVRIFLDNGALTDNSGTVMVMR